MEPPLDPNRSLDRLEPPTARGVADPGSTEALFQGIVDIASEAIISVDEDQRIIYFNGGAEEIFGYARAEAIGQPLDLLIPESARAVHRTHLAAFGESPLAARRMGERGEIHGRRKNGEIFPAEASISKLDAGDRRIYTAVLRDVTDRNRAEEGLRLLLTLTRAIAEARDLDDGLYVALEQVCRATGWVAGEAWVPSRDGSVLERTEIAYSRNPELDAFHEESQSMEIPAGRGLPGRVWATRRPVWSRDITAEPGFLRADLARRLGLRAAVAVPVLAGDEVVAVIGFYNFETREEDERLVDLVSAVANQLGALIRRRRAEDLLASHAQALARSNAELEQFASAASHDLQEPLRKIQAFGGRLAAVSRDALGSQGTDYLARMLDAAERMQALINDLLAFSRVTTRALPFESMELNAVVRRVLLDLEHRVHETGAAVHVEDLPVIDADPLQIRLLFQNLIGNALKFHAPGKRPVVRVRAEPAPADDGGAGVALVVEDEGIGFDEKYLDRIFNPFQRLHGRGQYDGTGMGLAICRKIAERHGGAITARSSPGQGAAFVVTLPERQHEGTPSS